MTTVLGESAGVPPSPASPLSIDDQWHRHFYESARHGMVFWRGVQLLKNPLDLIMFAEVIHSVMPRVIVETGTRTGGSALFLADMMTVGGVPNPRVITVDIARDENMAPPDPRITYITGSSIDLDVLDAVHIGVQGRFPRLVTLDSDHHPDHVFAELEAYSYLVTPGSYLIVEDTNIGHPVEPVQPSHGTGPWDGLARWLPDHPEFVPDPQCERFGVTFNVGAWLRRTD